MTQINTDLIPAIKLSFNIELPDDLSMEELKQSLSAYINQLIQTDFEKLVSLLYQIDVNESKLKYLLQENKKEDAGNSIAELILERQLQKIKSRRDAKNKNDISEDEKW